MEDHLRLTADNFLAFFLELAENCALVAFRKEQLIDVVAVVELGRLEFGGGRCSVEQVSDCLQDLFEEGLVFVFHDPGRKDN